MILTVVFLRALILCLLVVSWSAAAEQVNVATPSRGLIELPVIVAMRNGYFRSEGLEIQKIQIEPQVAVKALLAGEVDFNLAWEASVQAAVAGAPIRLVGAIVSKPLQILISRPEIRSAKDLIGKTLGVDAFSSMIDFVSRVAARYLGLEPDKQVGVVEVGNSALRLVALRAGEIHATAVDLAVAVKAEEEGFRRLISIGDIIDFPVSGIFVASAKLTKQPESVKRFLRATLRGARFIKQNRTEAVRIIQYYLKITPSQAARSYDSAIRAFAEQGLISDRVLAFSAWRAAEKFQLANDPLLSQLADWGLLREILAERRKIPFWLKHHDP